MNVLTFLFWQSINRFDQHVFEKINSEWTNPLFDAVMPFVRNPLNWAPLYLFILVLVLQNFKIKGIWWVVFFIAVVALTDMTGNYVFKHGFERLRPCNDPDFYTHVRLLLNHCGGGYSFISNHAANHFAMATFFFITFRKLLKHWVGLGIVWAALIAYAQVYVGVHYPFDVLAGALLGILIGTSLGFVFNKQFELSIFEG